MASLQKALDMQTDNFNDKVRSLQLLMDSGEKRMKKDVLKFANILKKATGQALHFAFEEVKSPMVLFSKK